MTEPTQHAQPKATRPRRFARESTPTPETNPETPKADNVTDTPKAPRESKISKVLDLLRCEQGATLAELIEATGWLPHTMRAALTGLRKKNHTIEKTQRDEVTCYRIAAAD